MRMCVVLCCVVSSDALPPSSTLSPGQGCSQRAQGESQAYNGGTTLLSLLDQSWTEMLRFVFGVFLRCRSLTFRALPQSVAVGLR